MHILQEVLKEMHRQRVTTHCLAARAWRKTGLGRSTVYRFVNGGDVSVANCQKILAALDLELAVQTRSKTRKQKARSGRLPGFVS